MQLIDTHTHLYLQEFDEDRDQVVSNAVSNNVSGMLMPNIDYPSIDLMLAAEKRYNGICHAMIGLHPTSVRNDFMKQLLKMEKIAGNHNFIAVGETGIDLYWDKTFVKEQVEAFRYQVNLALILDLPVVIHSREAFGEIFSVLNEFRQHELKGVFHAFTGDTETAKKAIGLGFMIGIGGIVTFKNSGLDSVVREIGPEHLVLETDSPYLAPVPHRGKRNESSYLRIINNKLAGIFGMDPAETARITSQNAKELFKLL